MMLRRLVSGAGWAFIVFLPLLALSMLGSLRHLVMRSRDWSDPLGTLMYLVQAIAPLALLALIGIGLGAACLLLVSVDRRLERLEDN